MRLTSSAISYNNGRRLIVGSERRRRPGSRPTGPSKWGFLCARVTRSGRCDTLKGGG